ncbi:MAG: hypothetical protein ACXV8I_05405 [Methylobacter sp.]
MMSSSLIFQASPISIKAEAIKPGSSLDEHQPILPQRQKRQ